jgi:hypothetical protein
MQVSLIQETTPECLSPLESRYDNQPSLLAIIQKGVQRAQVVRSQIERQRQFAEDFAIMRTTEEIGGHYYIASNKLPKIDNLEQLHKTGYLPPSDVYIGRLFYDLEDFHNHILQWQAEYQERLNQEAQKDQEFVDQINELVASGEVPAKLFGHFETIAVQGRGRSHRKAKFTSQELSNTEKIKRYAKYTIAQEVIDPKYYTSSMDIEIRRLSVATGVNLDKNSKFPMKVLSHAFGHEVIIGVSNLANKEELRGSVIYQKWIDVLESEPIELSTAYIRTIRAAGRAPGQNKYTKLPKS